MMESLPLACYLVGRLRAPADVVWLARAKTANFDTECSLAREELFGAGVAETIEYSRTLDGAVRARVLAELEADGVPLCSQAEVDHWWRAMAEYYPASVAEEHPLTLAAHAVDLDEAGEAVTGSSAGWRTCRERGGCGVPGRTERVA